MFSENLGNIFAEGLPQRFPFFPHPVVQGDGWYVLNEMWIPNGVVYDIVESGNQLFIGGNFTEVREWTGGAVPLDLSSGLVTWPNSQHKARVSGSVGVVIPDGNGGYYIGGNFNAVGGIPRNNLAQTLPDGSVGPWDPNANNLVNTLMISSIIFC